jgi:hypothetical protein
MTVTIVLCVHYCYFSELCLLLDILTWKHYISAAGSFRRVMNSTAVLDPTEEADPRPGVVTQHSRYFYLKTEAQPAPET